MSAAPKSKPLRRDKARLTWDATCFEDDAEQALKEIVAAQRFARKANEKVIDKLRLNVRSKACQTCGDFGDESAQPSKPNSCRSAVGPQGDRSSQT